MKNECKNEINRAAKGGENERSTRFAATSSTRGGRFCFLIPPPPVPALTIPGDGLHGGLLEGLRGRRDRRGIRNRLNIGTGGPASECKTLIRRRCETQNSIVRVISDMRTTYDLSVID